ncbi:MAG: DUF4118 domain-containing protein [Dehalococcoidia bacterium]
MNPQPGRLLSASFPYVATVAMVALMTLPLKLVQAATDASNVSMVYLVPVLASAILYGRWPAAFAAGLAFVAYDFWFVEPHYTLAVDEAAEVVSLALLLLSAVVVAQLASDQRDRRRESERREREALILYEVLGLLSDEELSVALHSVAQRLKDELHADAARVELSDGRMTLRAVAGNSARFEPETEHALGEATADRISGGSPGKPGRWVRVVGAPPRASPAHVYVVPINSRDRAVGAISIARSPGRGEPDKFERRLLRAVAAQLAGIQERASLQRQGMAAEVLKKTDEARTALLKALSHDLRTPLASIIASADSLLQREVAWSEGEQRVFAETVSQEAQRLNRIVGNLLDLSRVENGDLRARRELHDLGSLVDQVIGRLRREEAGHSLVNEVPEDLPPVPLDYVLMDQVFSNLLENGIRHTPAGSTITVNARAEDPAVLVVKVASDAGQLPEHVLARLGKRRQKITLEDARAGAGGLGLLVTRAFVEAHGGQLDATNYPGGGSALTIRLPLLPNPTPVATLPA